MTEPKPRKKRGRILREVVDHAPVWFVFLMSFGLLHYETSNVHPDRYAEAGIAVWKFALTAAIPVFWALVYYIFRVRTGEDLKWPKLSYFLLVLLFVGWPLVVYLTKNPRYLPDGQITKLYEYSQFVWLFLMVAHAWYTRGLGRVFIFFGACFLYGLALENTGIMLGYFGESHYQYYIGISQDLYLPAPVATQFGWCIMFYVAAWIASFIGERTKFFAGRPIRLALLATLVGLTLDLQIDPLASLSGLWWKWDPRLPGWWLGVPFLNYAAWFAAFLPFCYAFFYYAAKPELTDWQRGWRILILVPWMLPACMLIGMPIMAIYEGGFSGPSMQIFMEFLQKVMPY